MTDQPYVADGGPLQPDPEDKCRKCGKKPVMVKVGIPAELSHTGEFREAEKPIDACIADLVRALQVPGKATTRGSCCGHGQGYGDIGMEDGRSLVIVNWKEGQIYPELGDSEREFAERHLADTLATALTQVSDMIGTFLCHDCEESYSGHAHGRKMCPREAIGSLVEGALATYDGQRSKSKPGKIARSERALREAILDVLCSQPPELLGKHLRKALNESRDPEEHPEDRCEECREPFEHWHMPTEEWEKATGRPWGGPVLCEPCARRRLEGQPHVGLFGDRLARDHEAMEWLSRKAWNIAVKQRPDEHYEVCVLPVWGVAVHGEGPTFTDATLAAKSKLEEE